MSTLLAIALVLAATLAQLAIEASVGFSSGVPLLPVAALGAWARTRSPVDAWAAVPLAALLLGVASDERAGWFLLALLPAPLLASLTPRGGAFRTLATAAIAAGLGALAYLGLLTLAAGNDLPALADAGAPLLAAGWTALGACVLAVCLLPFRPRERGLFW